MKTSSTALLSGRAINAIENVKGAALYRVNIQHSSRSDSWRTPGEVIRLVHEVLGKIDLDPASDEDANLAVQAAHIWTREDNGLAQQWHTPGSIFLNPPGGKIGNQSVAALFWRRLMDARTLGIFQDAIFMAFSAEALQTTQGKGCPSLLAFPICVPAKRIRFVATDRHKADAPSHSNVIAYVPGRVDRTSRFLEVFSTLGACR